jgi:hypothetical protein
MHTMDNISSIQAEALRITRRDRQQRMRKDAGLARRKARKVVPFRPDVDGYWMDGHWTRPNEYGFQSYVPGRWVLYPKSKLKLRSMRVEGV